MRPTEYEGRGAHIAVAAGGNHALVLDARGRVSAWGDNSCGQLGNETTRYGDSPQPVDGLDSGVTAIAAGGNHSVVVTSDGEVLSWGWNFHGELGIGDRENRSRPVPVTGLAGPAVAIAAGRDHTLTLLEDGTVMAWGGGWLNRGLLGDGATESRELPVRVAGLTEIVAIDAGDDHSFAFDARGQTWAWGSNHEGALGDGTTEDRSVPVVVSVLPSPPAAVIAGSSHSLALIDGAAWAWGNNYNHQLGSGAVAEGSTPQPMAECRGRSSR